MGSADYDIVGRHYSDLRQPDPRIARLIHAKLKGAGSILNIGAGTGSYEPVAKMVTAVEPSETMIAQRSDGENTSVFRASAENLPFKSDSFDASMAILTIHHWNDWKKGLQEAMRVSRLKVVLLTWIGRMPNGFWLTEYFPEIGHIDKDLFPTPEQLSTVLGDIEIIPVPIPADCTDGFLCALWTRPESYLDARTRSAISTFSRFNSIEKGLKKLSADLKSGKWKKKYGHFQEMQEFDFGYRLVAAEK
jgi:SAM-dependent methyltransferase